jgi:hypothetical protein
MRPSDVVALEVESAVMHNAEAVLAVAVAVVAVEAVLLLAVAAAVPVLAVAAAEVVPGPAQADEAVAKAETFATSKLVVVLGVPASEQHFSPGKRRPRTIHDLLPETQRSTTMQRPEP